MPHNCSIYSPQRRWRVELDHFPVYRSPRIITVIWLERKTQNISNFLHETQCMWVVLEEYAYTLVVVPLTHVHQQKYEFWGFNWAIGVLWVCRGTRWDIKACCIGCVKSFYNNVYHHHKGNTETTMLIKLKIPSMPHTSTSTITFTNHNPLISTIISNIIEHVDVK